VKCTPDKTTDKIIELGNCTTDQTPSDPKPPVDCKLGNCKPNDQQAFCAQNPLDLRCMDSCLLRPMSTECKAKRELEDACRDDPRKPGCPDFCKENPLDAACKTASGNDPQKICGKDPFAKGCNLYCAARPTAVECKKN
jgi:hypothetical protein